MENIKKLIKTSCANHIDGWCLLKDKECPLISGGEYRGKKIPAKECSCNYFETAVLPSNKNLEAVYYGKKDKPNKVCKGCRKGFTAVSNRATYCSNTCRHIARKQTHVRHNQKRVK